MTEEIANVDAQKGWDGEAEHWARYSDVYDAANHPFSTAMLTAAAIEPADRVLDVGCGVGDSTREAARRAPDGSALGIDLAELMLAKARDVAAAEGLTNVEFARADAQVHRFDPAAFDVLISRFGGMFFADPVEAYRNLASALRPDGRLAIAIWQALADNEWVVAARTALAVGRDLPTPPPNAPGPGAFADPEYAGAVLDDSGFVDVAFEDLRTPMTFPASVDEVFEFHSTSGMVRGMLEGLDDARRAEALAGLRGVIESHAGPDGVTFAAAAWIVTARKG